MLTIVDLFLILVAVSLLITVYKMLANSREYIGSAARRDIVKDLTQSPRTKGEAYAIKILESITGAKFPTVRPSWLLYKGSQLELDGYNEELKLALEYSGPLHRKWFPNVETYENYLDRVRKDIFKRERCREHGVRLINLDSELPRRHWRDYLLSRMRDFAMIEEVPNYIMGQVFEPWIRTPGDLYN